MGSKRYSTIPKQSDGNTTDRFNTEEIFNDVASVADSRREMPLPVPTEPIGERVPQIRNNAGRKPKDRKIRRDYPKTIYFDEPTSMKLSDVRTKDKIEIKDLVLVATIEFLKRNFNEETRSLNEAAKTYIRKEMDRILETFSE